MEQWIDQTLKSMDVAHLPVCKEVLMLSGVSILIQDRSPLVVGFWNQG